ERAAATGVDWRDLAANQAAQFAADMAALRVLPPHTYLSVSETVEQVAETVAGLLEAHKAYRLDDGDVYADLSADPDFGSVAALDEPTMDTLFAERGGDPQRTDKRHRLDPVLWRAERPGEPAWDAPGLHRGRPGWHVECALIATAGLGPQIDVQGGGRDLLFPHHEMSTSHARLLGTSVRLQAHAGLVAYAGAKMSKSLGNLVFVRTLLADGNDPSAVRLAIGSHHYRTDWEWTAEHLTDAHARLACWRAGVARRSAAPAAPLAAAVRAALADDLDTPAALAAIDAWTNAEGPDLDAPAQVRALADALLGVVL
ncbi:MAG: cysteine--1-D-myo-inosityl 2-amino-2-deoxy-alpha-D-glucopyranoside ligase, partial [Micrococcales bacterium]|nr:cysteine--1-D-myo-inosityl 2-amino-2-deoxy-alpha-D-glucopyranoside ligase [Micrococcales bacterium]